MTWRDYCVQTHICTSNAAETELMRNEETYSWIFCPSGTRFPADWKSLCIFVWWSKWMHSSRGPQKMRKNMIIKPCTKSTTLSQQLKHGVNRYWSLTGKLPHHVHFLPVFLIACKQCSSKVMCYYVVLLLTNCIITFNGKLCVTLNCISNTLKYVYFFTRIVMR